MAVGCASAPRPDVGGAEVARLASPSPSAPAGADGPARPAVRAGDLPTAAPSVPPVRLRIPAIGMDATVDPVGVDTRTGEFAVPPSVDRVGWYRFGPELTARSGSIVIAGHVDGAGQGRGAFFRLRELDSGDMIEVVGADGRSRDFRVVARQDYRKSAVPLETYFARDGAVRLALITCGGPFDRDTRRYRDNLVVTAVPA